MVSSVEPILAAWLLPKDLVLGKTGYPTTLVTRRAALGLLGVRHGHLARLRVEVVAGSMHGVSTEEH